MHKLYNVTYTITDGDIATDEFASGRLFTEEDLSEHIDTFYTFNDFFDAVSSTNTHTVIVITAYPYLGGRLLRSTVFALTITLQIGISNLHYKSRQLTKNAPQNTTTLISLKRICPSMILLSSCENMGMETFKLILEKKP